MTCILDPTILRSDSSGLSSLIMIDPSSAVRVKQVPRWHDMMDDFSTHWPEFLAANSLLMSLPRYAIRFLPITADIRDRIDKEYYKLI